MTRSRWWRNYHAQAVKPALPKRTREGIAARNREMQKIAAVLGREFRAARASGVLS